MNSIDDNCKPPPPPPPPAPLPPPGGGDPGDNGKTRSVGSYDPNSLDGPAGYGPSRFVADTTFLPYRIGFENAATATAPAQSVTITNQLPPELDWRTFELTGMGFGNTNITIPARSQFYQTTVSTTENGQTFNVEVSASLNPTTGVLTVTFQSIDPKTGLPPANPLTGFLPPNDGTGVGDGYVSYNVNPRSSLASGTEIRNVALITFDGNPAIATDQVNEEDPSQGTDPSKQALVTIDALQPTSAAHPLPAQIVGASIPVAWSGSDGAGSGIATFNVSVSVDGGAYAPWLTNTTQTSGTYAGAVGHTYSFYSVATDNVGLIQPTPPAAQSTTTTVPPTVSPPPPATTPVLVGVPQFAVGSDSGGPATVTEYNPDRSVAAILNPFPGTTGGVRTAVADFNGDGIPDVAVGTGPGAVAEVKILDGKSGAVLFVVTPFADFTGGVFVAAGDITGDGKADLIITPDQSGGPRVEIYAGGDFQEIANFFGIDDINFRGGARAAVGDLNRDGFADLIIAPGFGGGPRIAVYDGNALAQGHHVKLVPDFFLFEPTLRNGAYVSAGDVNGDGLADIIGGAGLGGGPRVLVISGKTLLSTGAVAAIDAPIANFFAGDVNDRGGIRMVAKNLDGDKNADLVVGVGSTVTAYLGKNLAAGAVTEDYGFDAFPGFTGGVFVG